MITSTVLVIMTKTKEVTVTEQDQRLLDLEAALVALKEELEELKTEIAALNEE